MCGYCGKRKSISKEITKEKRSREDENGGEKRSDQVAVTMF